jgi:hypothetical protein
MITVDLRHPFCRRNCAGKEPGHARHPERTITRPARNCPRRTRSSIRAGGRPLPLQAARSGLVWRTSLPTLTCGCISQAGLEAQELAGLGGAGTVATWRP